MIRAAFAFFLAAAIAFSAVGGAQAGVIYLGQDLQGTSADDGNPAMAQTWFQNEFNEVFIEDFEYANAGGVHADFGNGVTAMFNAGIWRDYGPGPVEPFADYAGYWQTAYNTYLTISFSKPVIGFGVWLRDLDYGADLNLLVDGETTYQVPDTVHHLGTDNEITFLGFIESYNPFTQITLTGLTTYVDYDNMQIASAQTAVPLPAAVWFLGSGILGLAGVRRRMRQG